MTRRSAFGHRPSARGRWSLWPVAIGLVLASLVLAVPGPAGTGGPVAGAGGAAHLAPEQTAALTFTPSAGTVGSTVELDGTGFTSGQPVTPQFGGTNTTCTEGTVDVGTDGTFTCDLVVPVTSAGAYTIGAGTPADGTVNASVLFTVEPALSLDPTSGEVGSTTTATGTGFAPTSPITFQLEGTPAASVCTTDSTGSFSCAVTIPEVPAGAGTMVATDGSSDSADATFTVGPGLALAPTSGTVGSLVTITGSGFDASASITVSWDVLITVCTPTTGSDGGFSCGVDVPASTAGTNLVTAREQGSANTASASFTVNTSLNLTVGEGIAGTEIGLVGFGFEGSTLYTFCLQSTETGCTSGTSFLSDSNGTIPAGTTYTVPTGLAAGAYYLDVSQGTSFVIAAPFDVNSVVFSIVPASGSVGTEVSLSGSELVAEDVYSFCFLESISACGVSATTFTANSTGGIPTGTALIVPMVPTLTSGSYEIVVSQDSTVVAGAPFALQAAIVPSPAAGPVGTLVTVNATGLNANATYELTWNGQVQECLNVTGAEGGASCAFVVASTPAGATPIVLIEGSLSPSAEFTVTPDLEAVPGNGPVATPVSWTGAGFAASAAYSVSWNGTEVLCAATTDDVGAFNCTGAIPATPAGTYMVTASTTGASASSEWTVNSSLALSPAAGVVGTNVTATGEGYGSGGAYEVTWGGTILLCTGTTEGNGSFGCDFTLPVVPGGVGLVVGTQGPNEAGADFLVTPQEGLSATNGTVGSVVNVTGQGFEASSPVQIYWNGSVLQCLTNSTDTGTFSCPMAVPAFPAGTYPVYVLQGPNLVNATFTVVPQFLVTPASALAGATVTASGTGFTALAQYEVFWNSSTSLCIGTTDAIGQFSCSFVVPPTAPGTVTLFVAEGSFSTTFTFTVASVAPPPQNVTHNPYFWWAVLAVALVAALILSIALLLEARKHRRARAGTQTGLQPWGEGPTGMPPPGAAGKVPPAPAPANAPPAVQAPASGGEPDDIDDLMSRLERVSQLRYKKSPKELSPDESPPNPPSGG